MITSELKTQKKVIIWGGGALIFGIIVILSISSLRNSVVTIWDIFSSIFFQGWFFAGIAIGIVSLLKPTYDVITEKINYSQFTLYKNILLGFGGFFAIGGLITESLDDTIKLEQSYYLSNQEHHINILKDDVKRMKSYVGVDACSAESIFNSNIKSFTDKKEFANLNSDKVILCMYYKTFSEEINRVIIKWKSPKLIESHKIVYNEKKYQGVDALHIDLENKANSLLKISGYLNNKYNQIPTLSPGKIKEKSLDIINEFNDLEESKNNLKRIGSIKKIIFVGVGMDVVAILAAILLILIVSGKVSTHPKRIEP